MSTTYNEEMKAATKELIGGIWKTLVDLYEDITAERINFTAQTDDIAIGIHDSNDRSHVIIRIIAKHDETIIEDVVVNNGLGEQPSHILHCESEKRFKREDTPVEIHQREEIRIHAVKGKRDSFRFKVTVNGTTHDWAFNQI
jgi:hypothetical protein